MTGMRKEVLEKLAADDIMFVNGGPVDISGGRYYPPMHIIRFLLAEGHISPDEDRKTYGGRPLYRVNPSGRRLQEMERVFDRPIERAYTEMITERELSPVMA